MSFCPFQIGCQVFNFLKACLESKMLLTGVCLKKNDILGLLFQVQHLLCPIPIFIGVPHIIP